MITLRTTTKVLAVALILAGTALTAGSAHARHGVHGGYGGGYWNPGPASYTPNDDAVRRCVMRNFRRDPSRPHIVRCQARVNARRPHLNTRNDIAVRRCVLRNFYRNPSRPYVVQCQWQNNF